MKNAQQYPNLARLADSWPSAYVARQEIKKFSGGIITPKTLANLDCKGVGPEGRFRVGRKVVYHVDLFIKWFDGRATNINEN